MMYFYWISGVVLALAWLSRAFDAAQGMPSIVNIATPEWDRMPRVDERVPRVSIIVPARNEEEHVEAALTSMLRLEYENYEIIAVDDRSIDRTGEIMDHLAAQSGGGRLKVIHVSALPDAWLGKTHAMWTAGQQASGDWLLFTDADIIFKPDALRRAVAYAEQVQAAHLVLFPRMIMKSVGERMMLAFFQILFVFGHRPWKVADPKTKDHMGVGAFNLIRRPVYQAIGTYEALRLSVLDDMKLGQLVKDHHFPQRNVFGDDLLSLRWARSAMGVIENFNKNFFAIMMYRTPRTLGAVLLMLFLNLFPFLGVWLAHGWAKLPFAIAAIDIFGMYVGLSWYAPIPPAYFFLHPVSTCLFGYALLRSMILTLWHGGVIWRGTHYSLEELRRGLV